ncbi:serine hydrolase domain-containing protein [Christiangramia forsetii]|uniref:Secreted beta-lactamase family protein n=2 Tax=Christiangramia forsetii TaxID=411153 RepID=A0M255_CHRFK|nr:serine hydrolase domain-containing protein [Christiangramia forsetii]GGG40066.1 serine hydrolase [Christiangramia forsetii]CAL66700.1 secreted beta-lactamase family protein [Christiangramia forsetii KT0803]
MAKITIKILLLSLIISLFGCQNHESIDSYLNELYQNGKLNGNILVTKNNKIVYEKSFGFTDGSKSELLNKDYRFDIGSVFKEFPAVAIMQLKEKNHLNLNDKLSKHISGLPKWAEKISIKNLLQYSSGLPQIPWDEYFSKGIKITDEDIMKNLLTIENLEFEPGSDYLYSNNNPILLIKIVENITQSKFSDYVQENLFNPLNMNSTVINDQFPYKEKILMAIPFDTNFKEDDYEISIKNLLISSTARDMSLWFEQLDDFNVVNKQSIKTLSEEAKWGFNIQSPLGSCEWQNDKIMEHSHHGSSGNYECIVRRFKQDGITIVILTNQKHENVYDISNDIYKILRKSI